MYSVPSLAYYPTTVKDPQRTPATVSLQSFSWLPQTAATDQEPHPVSPLLISWSTFNTPYMKCKSSLMVQQSATYCRSGFR
jgi:hypothetical protein